MFRTIQIATVLIIAVFLMQSCVEKKPTVVNKNVQYVSGADEVTYLKLGKEITDTVGKTLKSNLVQAMENGGPVNALTFCNSQAMELTAIYSDKYNTEVKRVSDKNRNAANAASEVELSVLADFNLALSKGEPASPKVAIDLEGRKNYYAPIFTGGVCLSCHGHEKNLQPEVVSIIDSLYPLDKAKGYTANEIRGIWSIKFKNS